MIRQFDLGVHVYFDEPARNTNIQETQAMIAALGLAAQQSGAKLVMVNHEKAEIGLDRLVDEQKPTYLNVGYGITENPEKQYHHPPTYGIRAGAESLVIAKREGVDHGTIMLAQFFQQMAKELDEHKKRVM